MSKDLGWKVPSKSGEVGPNTRSKGADLVSPLSSDHDIKKRVEEHKASSLSEAKWREEIEFLRTQNLKLREQKNILNLKTKT